jgi:ABC-type oligopeptide transport system substrate-binding subunit
VDAEREVGPSLWTWGWVSDYPDPDGMLGTFLTSASGIREGELSPLLQQARALRARDERLELYREADRRLVSELVRVVPTIYDHWFVVHRRHVLGMWTHPMGFSPLDEVNVRRPP